MSISIGACGIDCGKCPAYLATIANDDAERENVARKWSEDYHANLTAKDINCGGCMSTEEPIFGYCRVCAIRKCVEERKIANCGFCDDYACERIQPVLQAVPAAKAALDAVRADR